MHLCDDRICGVPDDSVCPGVSPDVSAGSRAVFLLLLACLMAGVVILIIRTDFRCLAGVSC